MIKKIPKNTYSPYLCINLFLYQLTPIFINQVQSFPFFIYIH